MNGIDGAFEAAGVEVFHQRSADRAFGFSRADDRHRFRGEHGIEWMGVFAPNVTGSFRAWVQSGYLHVGI